jgi:hypothetical protein
MPNYANSKLYAIRSHQTEDIYIGATVVKLARRMAKHRCGFKQWTTGKSKHYVTSYEILKREDAYIELLQTFPCLCKEELDQREGQLIRETECVNKNIPGRTLKQYREDNIEKIQQWKAQYYQDNTDKLKAKQKQYYAFNTDKIKQYKIDNAEKINQQNKQYRAKHADKTKQYRIDNAEKTKQYRSGCPQRR